MVTYMHHGNLTHEGNYFSSLTNSSNDTGASTKPDMQAYAAMASIPPAEMAYYQQYPALFALLNESRMREKYETNEEYQVDEEADGMLNGSVVKGYHHRRPPRRPTPRGPRLTQRVTCTEGVVWLMVVENNMNHVKMVHLSGYQRPACLQILYTDGGDFWFKRMAAVHEYLLSVPNVSHAVLTDIDAISNPISLKELMSHFESIATPEARVVWSMEQTCWCGHICNQREADAFLKVARNFSGNPSLNMFPNSQYMGERSALIEVLAAMMNASHDDQRAIFLVFPHMPGKIAFDFDEKIFLSMARGFGPQKSARLRCAQGGNNFSYPCGPTGPTEHWGSCTIEENRVVIHDQEKNRTRTPLSIHLNGPAAQGIRRGADCGKILNSRLVL